MLEPVLGDYEGQVSSQMMAGGQQEIGQCAEKSLLVPLVQSSKSVFTQSVFFLVFGLHFCRGFLISSCVGFYISQYGDEATSPPE